jgi:dGTPase
VAAGGSYERNERRYGGDKSDDNRSRGARDRDRILYAPAFQRLGGVTQVVLAQDEGHLLHNRLTHSLKVGQVGRRIAEKLLNEVDDLRKHDPSEADAVSAEITRRGGLDSEVVEAAGLAHDLGHPPFGHIAEDKLNSIFEGHKLTSDSYEGNAQSFRIVTRLSRISENFLGLNLTRATLNAILKYPWPYDSSLRLGRKWGCYESDKEYFDWAREGLGLPPGERTLEAEIMDWADDITYAIHDVEDFYRAGLIPLARIRRFTPREAKSMIKRVQSRLASDHEHPLDVTEAELLETFLDAMGLFPLPGNYGGTEYERLVLQTYSSGWISRLIRNTQMSSAGLQITKDDRLAVALFKELTKRYVVENPVLVTQQEGQRHVISDLFETYLTTMQEGARKYTKEKNLDAWFALGILETPGVGIRQRQ